MTKTSNIFQKVLKRAPSSESGNTIVIVLVALVVVAVGALAYLSGQMAGEDIVEQPAAQTAAADAQTEPASGENAEQPAIQVPPEQPQIDIQPGNPVVAKVNGAEINRVEVFNFIQSLPEQSRQIPIDQLFSQALDQVVNTKIVQEKAAKADLSNDPLYKERLEAAKKQIASTVFLQNAVEKEVTEERLQQAYQLYVENFPEIEEVKARHILVEDEAKAKELIDQLNNGASFEELAKANSKDGTAENGGDLGYFAAKDVVPEFSEVAFAMEPGAYTKEPVKTQFGYHVIKMEEKRQRPPAEFEEAKSFLETQIRQAVLTGVVEGWRNEAQVEKFDINGNKIEPASGEEATPAPEAAPAPAPAAEEAPAAETPAE